MTEEKYFALKFRYRLTCDNDNSDDYYEGGPYFVWSDTLDSASLALREALRCAALPDTDEYWEGCEDFRDFQTTNAMTMEEMDDEYPTDMVDAMVRKKGGCSGLIG